MILHDSAGQLSPAKAAAVRTDQIPSLFPLCGECQAVQVILYLAAFCIQTDRMDHILRFQGKSQRVRRLKTVFLHIAQIQAVPQEPDAFTAVSASERLRENLLNSCARLVTEEGFDGVDFDWEYPCVPSNGMNCCPEDKHNYSRLRLKTLRIDRSTSYP